MSNDKLGSTDVYYLNFPDDKVWSKIIGMGCTMEYVVAQCAEE